MSVNEITPDEILRDRLLFGIINNKVRERLLRETGLTLTKTDEICRASESTIAQMKVVQNATETVSTVNTNKETKRQPGPRGNKFTKSLDRVQRPDCWNCGRQHDLRNKETNCPAYGKTCTECSRLGHFASVCRAKQRKAGPDRSVRLVEGTDSENEELFTTHDVNIVTLDDSQLVTLRLESGNWIRFQPDTGAQCNVIPLHLYKQASKDYGLVHVKPSNTTITAYGGAKVKVAGKVRFHAWRDNDKYLIECKLVDTNEVMYVPY